MKKQRRSHEQRWTCSCCDYFQAISLRTLLNHYNKVHGHEPNFRVVCNVNGCPATFTKYNSLYKHITRWHVDVYKDTQPDNDSTEDNVDDGEGDNDDDPDTGGDNILDTVDSSSGADSVEELLETDMDEYQVCTNPFSPSIKKQTLGISTKIG